MNYSPYDFVTDIAIMSIILILSQVMRCSIKWLQDHYVPSSIIAGIIGLILGPQLLNIVHWSSKVGSYPYLMTCVLFAGIFLGRNSKISIKSIIRKTGDTFFINTASEILCFGVALFFGGIIISSLYPNVFSEICLLLPAGFAGGHGYAAAIGGALNKLLNREDAVFIGQTFATLGLLTGLFIGIGCINFAARRGYTCFVKKASLLPMEYRTGLVEKDNRQSIGDITINSVSMDSFTYHIMLIMGATGIGFYISKIAKDVMPSIELPLMCLTMLSGLALQLILNETRYCNYIDKRILDRISGTLTDYLVSFGIATIKISVVISYWQPILILSVIGIVFPLVIVFLLANSCSEIIGLKDLYLSSVILLE